MEGSPDRGARLRNLGSSLSVLNSMLKFSCESNNCAQGFARIEPRTTKFSPLLKVRSDMSLANETLTGTE